MFPFYIIGYAGPRIRWLDMLRFPRQADLSATSMHECRIYVARFLIARVDSTVPSLDGACRRIVSEARLKRILWLFAWTARWLLWGRQWVLNMVSREPGRFLSLGAKA